MAIKVGIGFSKDDETVKAAQEAALAAKEHLEADRIDMVLLFTSMHYDPKVVLPIIYQTLNQTKLVGSSTAGIHLSDGIHTRGIAVAAIFSDEARFETSHLGHIDLQDAYEAGKILAKNALTDFTRGHRQLIITFIDSLLPEPLKILQGMKDHLGVNIPIFGGGSTDNFLFQKGYQYHKNLYVSLGASAILLGGHAHFGVSRAHGWIPIGKPRMINRCETNVVKTIDNKPAKELYKEFFEEREKKLEEKTFDDISLRYPLGLKTFPGRDKYLIRYVTKTLKDGSLVCRNYVMNNTEAHLMIGTKDSWLLATEAAARDVKKQLKNREPQLIFIIESLARHKILGQLVNKEIAMIKSVLGESVPIIGLYVSGEIYTPALYGSPTTHIHNGNIIIIGLC